MDKKGIKTELPFLQLKTTAKAKPKAAPDRRSRNVSSLHGINDMKLKELLTTYLNKHPSPGVTRNAFNSIDKGSQVTHMTSNPDIPLPSYSKYKRIYPQQHQMHVRNKRLQPSTHIKSGQMGLKRSIHHDKAMSMFELVNVLKPQMSHRTREANTVMNIVNNLNGTGLSLNQTNGGNKNVEINFNKYEIKILSDKNQSSHCKDIAAIHECVSKEIEQQQKDNYKDSTSSKVIIVDSYKGSNEEEGIAQTENHDNEVKAEKQQPQMSKGLSLKENEESEMICSNNSKKVTQLVYRQNSVLKPSKAAQAEEPKENKLPSRDYAHADTNNTNTYSNGAIPIKTQPHFTSCMTISNENCMSLLGVDSSQKLKQRTPLNVRIKTDTNEEVKDSNSPSNIGTVVMSKLKLNADDNILQLSPTRRSIQSKEEECSIDNKDVNKIFSKKEMSKFSKPKPSISHRKESTPNKNNRQPSKALDSSDISNDDEDNCIITRQISPSSNSNFILNNLQVQTLKKDLATQDYTSTEATNTYSARHSSDIIKVKETSAHAFLLKRTPTNFLPHKPASIPNNANPSPFIKLKAAMSPKKNKRFLKQLSRISEISNKKRNAKKDKLVKSSSLPLISIEKISNILELKKPSRQLTCLHVIKKKKISLSHHNSFDINQKNVIEEEQLSEMHYSKESSSSRSNRTKREIKKKPSVLSNGTGINFFEMRSNSIQITTNISKCFSMDNRVHCQAFIEKFIEEIKLAQNDIDLYSTEAKNDLLHKTILTLDLKCEKIEDQRRTTYTQYAFDTFSNWKQQSYLNVRDFLQLPTKEQEESFEEEDVINEYGFYSYLMKKKEHSPSSISLSPLFDRYFEIDLLVHLEKEKYLESNYYEGDMSIIENFTKYNRKIYKKLKTANSIRNAKSIRKTVTFRVVAPKVNAVIINSEEYFRFVQMDDEPVEEKGEKVINFQVNPYKKVSSATPKKTYKRNESKNIPKRQKSTLFKKNSTRLSITSKKSLEDNYFAPNSKKDSVLQKQFYDRERDSLNNFDFDREQNTSFRQKGLVTSKKREELYMSPLKYRASVRGNTKKKSLIVKDFLHFNKESVMFKTYEIKTKLLTEMENYIDTMFFYIKDSNFHNFRDMFLKHKVSPEVEDKDGNSFLNVAVQSGSGKIVMFLLNNSSNVNTQNKLLNSPLHYALSYKNFALADILIKFGANEKLKNRFGKTPWECFSNWNSVI